VLLFSDNVAMITIARHHCGRMAGAPVWGRRHQARAACRAGMMRVLKGEAAVGGRRQGAVWAVPAPGLRRSRAQAQERDGVQALIGTGPRATPWMRGQFARQGQEGER
jgi:hypothetical protein